MERIEVKGVNMNGRQALIQDYWNWCCMLQAKEVTAEFEIMKWLGGVRAHIYQSYVEARPHVGMKDLLKALLSLQFFEEYEFDPADSARKGVVDFEDFDLLYEKFNAELFMNVDFARASAMRSTHRRRDLKIAKRVQKILAKEGWISARNAPGELKSTFDIGQDEKLTLSLDVPHGSLTIFFIYWVDQEAIIQSCGYLDWIGLKGPTECWSEGKENAEKFGDFVIEQARNFLDFLRDRK